MSYRLSKSLPHHILWAFCPSSKNDLCFVLIWTFNSLMLLKRKGSERVHRNGLNRKNGSNLWRQVPFFLICLGNETQHVSTYLVEIVRKLYISSLVFRLSKLLLNPLYQLTNFNRFLMGYLVHIYILAFSSNNAFHSYGNLLFN